MTSAHYACHRPVAFGKGGKGEGEILHVFSLFLYVLCFMHMLCIFKLIFFSFQRRAEIEAAHQILLSERQEREAGPRERAAAKAAAQEQKHME